MKSAPSPRKTERGQLQRVVRVGQDARRRPASPETRKVSPRQPPLGQRLLDRQDRRRGRAPARPRRAAPFVSRSEEVRLKGQLLEGLGGPPPPEHPPWSRGKPWPPLGRTLLPAWLVDPQFLKESSPVCRDLGYSRFIYLFIWWVGGTCDHGLCKEENVRLLQAGCNTGGWRRHQSPSGFTL